MSKYLMVGAACAGLVLGYVIYKKAGAVAEVVGDAVGDAAQAVNPFNNDNVINQGFEYLYRELTGSEGNPGSDLFDATHGGALDITSDQNFIYKSAVGAVDTAAWVATEVAGMLDPRNIAKQLEEWW